MFSFPRFTNIFPVHHRRPDFLNPSTKPSAHRLPRPLFPDLECADVALLKRVILGTAVGLRVCEWQAKPAS